MANGPAGMTTRERERSRSQNFGSNIVIGGNPGDAGGSTTLL